MVIASMPVFIAAYARCARAPTFDEVLTGKPLLNKVCRYLNTAVYSGFPERGA
jgi:hypothetical protein